MAVSKSAWLRITGQLVNSDYKQMWAQYDELSQDFPGRAGRNEDPKIKLEAFMLLPLYSVVMLILVMVSIVFVVI